LRDYLIMPIQRIPRYELLLKEIEKKIDNSSPLLYSLIREALRIISDVGVCINDAITKKEAQQVVSKMAENMMNEPADFQLLQPHRKMIKDGSLKVSMNANSFDGHVTLLTDIILITKTKNSHVQFKYTLDLVSTAIYDVHFNNEFSLDYNISGRLCFLCKDVEEKNSWFHAIDSAIREQDKRLTQLGTIKTKTFSTRTTTTKTTMSLTTTTLTTTTLTTTTLTTTTTTSLFILVLFKNISRKSSGIGIPVHVNYSESLRELLKKMRQMIREMELLDDMSQFETMRFGFVLQEKNKFIDETTQFRTLFPKPDAKDQLQLTCTLWLMRRFAFQTLN